MTFKTSTALFTAMTMAFAAPAFAGETPPGDDPTQVETHTQAEAKTQTETRAEPETGSLLKETPIKIESEVAGEIATSNDIDSLILSEPDMDVEFKFKTDSAVNEENKLKLESEMEGDIKLETDIKSDPNTEILGTEEPNLDEIY